MHSIFFLAIKIKVDTGTLRQNCIKGSRPSDLPSFLPPTSLSLHNSRPFQSPALSIPSPFNLHRSTIHPRGHSASAISISTSPLPLPSHCSNHITAPTIPIPHHPLPIPIPTVPPFLPSPSPPSRCSRHLHPREPIAPAIPHCSRHPPLLPPSRCSACHCPAAPPATVPLLRLPLSRCHLLLPLSTVYNPTAHNFFYPQQSQPAVPLPAFPFHILSVRNPFLPRFQPSPARNRPARSLLHVNYSTNVSFG